MVIKYGMTLHHFIGREMDILAVLCRVMALVHDGNSVAEFVDTHPQKNAPESEMPPAIFVSDYIAGMTDSYAMACFNELYKN